MGNNASRSQYFEEYDINPYEVLGIPENEFITEDVLKRNYKVRAKKVHPDRSGSDTKLAFQILQQCYLFLKEEMKIQQAALKPSKTHNELRDRTKEEDILSIPVFDRPMSSRGAVDHSAFTTKRNDYLLNDLDFDLHEKEMTSKKLSREDINIVKALRDEKFDREKFNILFEYINKDDSVKGKKLVKYDPKPIGASSTLPMNKVRYYNGILLATEEAGSDEERVSLETLKKSKATPEKAFDELIDQKTYGKIKREMKKDSGKMAKKKALEKANNRENISVNTNMSYKQMEQKVLYDKLKEIQQEIEENERFVKKNSRILPKELREKAFSGLLEDSSQAIRAEGKGKERMTLEFIEPTGRRKK